MFCANCNSQVAPGAKNCPVCGAAIQQQQPYSQVPPQQPYGQVPPQQPYGQVPPQQPYGQALVAQKSPGLALFLSCLLAGIGQMYNGQVAKGIVLLVIEVLFWGLFLGWVVSIVAMIDAYKIAEKINQGRVVGDWEFF